MKRIEDVIRQGGRLHLASSAALLVMLVALATVQVAFGANVPVLSDVSASGQWVREPVLPPPDQLGPAQPSEFPGLPSSPPDNPQIGDSWLWWLFIHVGMPHFEERMCTVRGLSDRGYVVVEDTQWNVNIFQEDVDEILERWENSSIGDYSDQGIYDLNVEHFGEPPDELDDDPRIYIMWFDFGNTSDGFFFWFDEYPDGYAQYPSNECEVLYLNTANGQDPSGEYMVAVIAHEFEHQIHWLYDENEDTWVDEGLAELAMWFYGNPDHISSFNSNPDNQLTDWGGNWADYIKTYLWTLYFFEHYGGQETVYAVVHNPANSITGYENVLDDFGYSEDFADVFADWIVANFLDDTSLADGRFGYEGDDLPPFNVMGTYNSYPVPDQTRSVNHWAADYYRFENLGSVGTLSFGFDGSDSNEFAVWVLGLHADGTTDVLRMPIDDATQSGTQGIGGLSHPDTEVILAVASISSVGTVTYTFNAEANAADVAAGERAVAPPRALALTAGPNPTRGAAELELRWALDAAEQPRVAIHDAQGRLVRRLAGSDWAAERAVQGSFARGHVMWDGRDAAGRLVPPGVYYARASAAGETSEARVVVIR